MAPLQFSSSSSPVHSQHLRTLIVKKRKYDQIIATIRNELHWLLVQLRLDYKLCNFTYKCLHQRAPLYLSSVCIHVGEITIIFAQQPTVTWLLRNQ